MVCLFSIFYFQLFISLRIKYFSHRRCRVRSWFVIQFGNPCLLIWVFSLFTFKIIIKAGFTFCHSFHIYFVPLLLPSSVIKKQLSFTILLSQLMLSFIHNTHTYTGYVIRRWLYFTIPTLPMCHCILPFGPHCFQ